MIFFSSKLTILLLIFTEILKFFMTIFLQNVTPILLKAIIKDLFCVNMVLRSLSISVVQLL